MQKENKSNIWNSMLNRGFFKWQQLVHEMVIGLQGLWSSIQKNIYTMYSKSWYGIAMVLDGIKKPMNIMTRN